MCRRSCHGGRTAGAPGGARMLGGEAERAAVRPRRMPSSGGDYSRSAPGAHLTADRDGVYEPFETGLLSDRPRASRRLIFPGLWLFIGFVSSLDTYLTLKFQEHLRYHELNPLARMLLRMDNWDPSLLIGAKFLGTFLVLGILAALRTRNRPMALAATV